jgi:hypothetical protein
MRAIINQSFPNLQWSFDANKKLSNVGQHNADIACLSREGDVVMI